MAINSHRRQFLRNSAALTALGALPGLSMAQSGSAPPVLVLLLLRGGIDGLNVVVPYQDANYYDKRAQIAIPTTEVTDLDGFFGLNNHFGALTPLFNNNELSFINAVGGTSDTRSHFEAQDNMDEAGGESGWLSRVVQAMNPTVPHAVVNIGYRITAPLFGTNSVVTIESIADQRTVLADLNGSRSTLAQMFAPSLAPVWGASVASALSSLNTTAAIDDTPSVTYPVGSYGSSFSQIAALIKADIGVNVITMDAGGWDHHANLLNGLAARGKSFADALAAFRLDLGTHFDRTLVLGISEFGRQVPVNGTQGTEHGRGGLMFALGGGLRSAAGGRIILADNAWPGLADQDLVDGNALQVTTDYRNVYAEVIDRYLGLGSDLATILPGHTVDSANYPGLLAT